jgi:quercetin 2,3-dioxygenase
MKKLLRVHRQPEGHWVGDGFPVHTVLDYGRHPELSPFLLLDHAGPADFAPAAKPRGVGWHPHRGFETVTVVFDGEVDHEDTAGNGGRVGPGDVQWMTAGSGLLHKELHSPEFTRRGGKFHMLQLWVNLPAKSKMTKPRYQTLLAADIPVVDGVRVIAGEYGGARGPAQTFTPVNLLEARLRAGQKLRLNLRDGFSAGLYIVHGETLVNGEKVQGTELAGGAARHHRRDRVRDERRADRRAGGRLRPVRHEYQPRNPAGVRRLPRRPPGHDSNHNDRIGRFIVIDNRTAPYAALVLRVTLGVMFIAHSLVLKYFVFTLPGTAQFFQSLGLPGVLAYVTFWAELLGGIALVVGFATRWVALALVPILLGAAWVHLGNGWVFSATNGGWEYPVFLIAASLVQSLLGDGKYALTLKKEIYA